ncbi:dihydropteroate synthase [Sphingomonas donggukensis]|uniref:dihydropteroate synthase n=1 Tax=Sphingomonas donggukensis TaxID=2949093 RepID=A0ABY4TSN8_9SPHN|nr:dihydropteroate synthase [Sphingomonas donggukensis]URW75416.1 dihydropteroate synthase [Sphingomonas donggukensis]
MFDPATLPPTARLYLRPEAIVDTPVGRDGEVARLAGGLLWFAAYELIAVVDGARVVQASVPIAALPGVIANLPASQAARLRLLAERISATRAPLILGPRTVRLDQPQVMGILNVTPDSFSDGGAHGDDPQALARIGFDMGTAGAALVDVGGESTRPGAKAVWEGDEVARVEPVVRALAATGTPVSIDTRKAAVMTAALGAGASVVNDVAALAWDDRALGVAARAGCPVVLMHSPEPASGPHAGGGYGDVAIEVFDWLEARIEAVVAGGVDRSRILIDPGIGFAKTLADNLALLNALTLFHGLGCAVVLGASRKRLIGALSNEAPVDERLGGSLTLALHGANAGVQMLRVHDVAETAQALRVWRGLRDAALTSRRD